LTDDDVVFIFSECDSNIYDVIYVGFGLFFLSNVANNGENETGFMIVKGKSVAKPQLERYGFLT